ncbi:hypothetical protein A3A38_01775 [Candidatus Kaiserbacteria bacterium RIFCSPLOWO2_01_FULL_53_17]|uniref:Uncharacterized protein n=1 Tax=Candidatus Kaiserbacteria bacterium RIFCSPLOWO2_01_FULL_53_17 TaxID=1798511 RepID=A0A1F6EIP1_9BACT|nr:MAG: hypothetical protein A3A38_01775 [Candidatus Kaiserbacteria bacterium RIFCSPLOWO2_01_FULL_53_17]
MERVIRYGLCVVVFLAFYTLIKSLLTVIMIPAAYFIYSFLGGAGNDIFRESLAYGTIIVSIYFIAIIISVYISIKVSKWGSRVLFRHNVDRKSKI